MAKKSNELTLDDIISQYSADKQETFINTDIYTIDGLLGGGVSPGAMYAIWGPQGSGKCLEVNSRVITDKGYIKMSDMRVSDDEWQDIDAIVKTPSTYRNVDKLYFKKGVKTISLLSNKWRTTTPNHPILAVKDGKLQMYRTDQLSVGDYIAVYRHPIEFPNEIGEELSYWTGAMLGDGFCENSKIRKSLGFIGVPEFVKEFIRFTKFTGAVVKISREDRVELNTVRERIADNIPALWETFRGKTAETKTIPEEIFKSSIKDRMYFIYGILDTDGTVSPTKGSSSFDITLKSKELILGIAQVFETLGMIGRYSEKVVNGTVYYRYSIGTSEFYHSELDWSGIRKEIQSIERNKNIRSIIPLNKQIYEQIRDFATASGLPKAHRYGKRYEEHKHKTRLGKILSMIIRGHKYLLSRMNYEELCRIFEEHDFLPEFMKIYNDYSFVPIREQKETVSDVADVSLSEEHLFYSEGMLNHNTSLALQIVKKFCKLGHKVVFVDVEKSFNKNQQTSFGLRQYVESGLLLHLTVDNYSQLMDVCKAVAKDGSIKLVAIDSESALQPSLSEDVDVTDNQPGRKARQSSLALTAIHSLFYNSGIASIVLFHARANISMTANPYAPATKQAGGFGAKHVPDVILQVQPGQKIKEGDSIVGQIVHLECDKNKFTSPFNRIDAKIYFGKGISKRVEIVDKAIELGIIQQSGAFFKFGDETVRGTLALYQLDDEKLLKLKELIDNGK